MYSSTNPYLVDDCIVIRVEVNVRKPNLYLYDSRAETGFVGLKNQGATCYMNSLLQTLYNINYFRQSVYHMPTTDEEAQRNIPLALQNLFYKVGRKTLGASCTWIHAQPLNPRARSAQIQDFMSL